MTAFGNAKISRAVTDPWGFSTGVLAFDGSGDYITTPAHADFSFGTSAFTVEAWVNVTGNGTLDGLNRYFQMVCGTNDSTAGAYGEFNLRGNGSSAAIGLNFWDSAAGGDINDAMSKNTWYHVAWSRSSNTVYMAVNGNVQSVSYSGTIGSSTKRLTIGGNNTVASPYYLVGYCSNLRITKGVARYTSNFVPPSSAFIGP